MALVPPSQGLHRGERGENFWRWGSLSHGEKVGRRNGSLLWAQPSSQGLQRGWGESPQGRGFLLCSVGLLCCEHPRPNPCWHPTCQPRELYPSYNVQILAGELRQGSFLLTHTPLPWLTGGAGERVVGGHLQPGGVALHGRKPCLEGFQSHPCADPGWGAGVRVVPPPHLPCLGWKEGGW